MLALSEPFYHRTQCRNDSINFPQDCSIRYNYYVQGLVVNTIFGGSYAQSHTQYFGNYSSIYDCYFLYLPNFSRYFIEGNLMANHCCLYCVHDK